MMDKSPTGRNAEFGLSTRAIHHGYDPAEEHGALTPPIFMTSTYAFESGYRSSARWASHRERKRGLRPERRRPVYWRRAKASRASGLLKRKSRRSPT